METRPGETRYQFLSYLHILKSLLFFTTLNYSSFIAKCWCYWTACFAAFYPSVFGSKLYSNRLPRGPLVYHPHILFYPCFSQYYIDPVSGRQYRSMQEVFRYLKSKDSRKVESKPDDKGCTSMELVDHSQFVSGLSTFSLILGCFLFSEVLYLYFDESPQAIT